MDEKQICERYRIYFLVITSKYSTQDYCPIDPSIIDKIVLFHAKYGYIPNTFYKLLHFLLRYPFDEQLFEQLLNLLKIKSVADSAIEICINMLQKIDVNLTKSFLVYCDRRIKHLNTDRANTLRDLLADLYNENENLGDTFEDEAMSTTSSIDSQQKSESDEDMDELQNRVKNDFGTKSDDTKSELTDSETKEVDSDSVPTKNRESTPPSVVDSSSFIVDERIDESEVIESEMSTESKNTSQSAENETCDEETQEVNESSDECQADQDNDEETQEVNESSDEYKVDQAKEEEEEKLSSQGNEECLLENDRSKELNYITDNRAREDIINSNKLIDNENNVHQSDSDIEEIDNTANKIYETEVTKSLPLDFFVSSENETSEKVKKLKTNGSFNTHMNVEPSKISVTPWKTANVDGIKYLSLKKKREDSPNPVIIRNSNSDRNTVPKPFATTNTCNFGALNEFTTKKNIDFDRQMMQNSYKAFNPKPLINKSSKVYIDSIKDLEDSKVRIEPPHIKIGSQIAKQDNMQESSQTVKSTFNPYSYTKNNMLPPRQSDSNKKNVSNNADIYHAILSAKGPLKTIESKKIKFCDFESYRQYFNPLIINEILANIEKGLSEMNRNEVNFIKFSYVEKGTHLDEIYFNFDKCNLCENDAILVINKKDKNNIENVCIVKAVNNPMKIVKVLVAKENNTFSKYGDYTYCYIASLNTYFREYTAIQTLKDYSHLQDIISPVHDKEVVIDEAVKNEVQSKLNINEYQAGAVAHCVNTARRIALIQGPPGTGKTTTIVSLISAFYSGLFKFDKFGDKQRILICAPSNTAIDEVARRILKNGVKLLDDTVFMPNLLRVGVSNNISPEIRNITFEHMFEQNEIKNTHHREAERVKILNNCDIVLSTLSSSTHDCLFSIRMNFELIIVDEACQSVELSTILPLKHRHKKLVLIGDPMQLTPTTISPSQLYSMSLYQRLLNFLPIFMLGIQYRMTNLIAEFPSSHFYGGMLKTDKSCQNRISPFKAPFPEIAFVNIIGKEIRNKTNGFSNQKEVFALIKFLYTLHEQKSFTFAKNIAIITPYKTQAFLITATLKKMISEKKIDRNILKHVEINTVDAFQGQEKDLVIISTVRTKNIGFINDASRMNVMLTRAKFSVVIFGNSQFLAKDKLWMKLLCFYGANDAISSENKFMEFIENFNK